MVTDAVGYVRGKIVPAIGDASIGASGGEGKSVSPRITPDSEVPHPCPSPLGGGD